MDTGIIPSPYTQYLPQVQTPVQAEKGVLCLVEDFDEFRKMPSSKGNDYIAVTKDFKYMFLKRVDKDGNMTIGSFDPNPIPNPVPVTENQLSDRINTLESNFNTQFSELKAQMSFIYNKLMEGEKKDGNGGVLQQNTAEQQQHTGIPAVFGSKEPFIRQ